jgi:hypothetical protein
MALLPSYFTIQVAFAPLPQPYMVALRLVEIETAVDQASIFRLHFDLSRNFMGDFDVLAIDIFRPLLPVRISISAMFGLPICLINGYVRDVKLSGSNEPGKSTLQIVGIDAFGTLMSHVQAPMTWPVVPDSVIAATIFSKYAIRSVVVPTPPTRNLLDPSMTQQEHDAQWLLKIARRNGFEVYIRPDPVVGSDIGYFTRPLTMMPPQAVLSLDFGSQTNLVKFDISYDMLAPSTIVGVTTDPTTRLPVPAYAPFSTDLPMGLEPTLLRILPPPIEYFDDSGLNPAEVQARALARATETSRAVHASGQVDAIKLTRPLMAGLPVLIRGAGREYSGLYYITSVTHQISRDDYTQSFTAYRNAVGLTGAEIFIDPLAPAA